MLYSNRKPISNPLKAGRFYNESMLIMQVIINRILAAYFERVTSKCLVCSYDTCHHPRRARRRRLVGAVSCAQGQNAKAASEAQARMAEHRDSSDSATADRLSDGR